MASERSNSSTHPNQEENSQLVDDVASLSVNSSNLASSSAAEGENADASPSATTQPQSPPVLLYNTREGRIATYRRMFESNRWPEQLANFEALIKYYEDGGRVPQGKEEVWAFDGQASFGIRFYTHLDQMPEGWLYKRRFCDTVKYHQLHYVPGPDEFLLADREGKVIL